jgi:hypothetical protein
VDPSELEDFVVNQMSMSHIYQPLLIRALLDCGGTATLRQLAIAFVESDESQLRYYEDRIKKMPLRVLRRHGIVGSTGDVVRLATGKLTYEQRARLRALCEMKIGNFLERRGLSTWDYRLLELDPVPESVRYQVLARDRRCRLCGEDGSRRRLEIDHILPRSRGGSNDLANLQVLCELCNRGKANRDSTDFRS